jgi:TonB family protein
MKKLLILILILNATLCEAQDTLTSFYDHSWKLSLPEVASYYSVAIKQDSSWRGYFFYMSNDKLLSEGYYVDNALKKPTGPFRSFDSLGHLLSRGYYLNGKKYGIWKYWYPEGKLSDSVFYKDNIITFERSYYQDGNILETIDTDSTGKTLSQSFWNDGSLKMEGEMVAGEKHGLWKVHVPEQDLIQEVMFIKDSVASVNCKTGNGKPVKECIYEKDADMKGGIKAWQGYLLAALTHYMKLHGTGACEGRVVVRFIIDKDGKIIEPRVVSSSNPALNNTALEIIRRGPRWNPAIQYNRKVKAYREQPITFKCSE